MNLDPQLNYKLYIYRLKDDKYSFIQEENFNSNFIDIEKLTGNIFFLKKLIKLLIFIL